MISGFTATSCVCLVGLAVSSCAPERVVSTPQATPREVVEPPAAPVAPEPQPAPPKIAAPVTREATPAARELRREELRNEASKSPGWAFYETAHYFILTSVDDQDFVSELKERCERIHRVIEVDLPDAPLDPVPVMPAPSVIRVCKNAEEFHGYGGAVNSASYWSSESRELVLYDAKDRGGRRATWASLNGRICVEYLCVLRNMNPATWFAEGHADYYSGFELTKDGFHPKAFDWRVRTIQEAIRRQQQLSKDGKPERAHAPLQQLVRFTQAEYYGQNKLGLDGGLNYAQGWSFIWFLRQAKAKSPLWQPAWDHILGNWWSAFLETSDSGVATERAFAGVDWAALESASSSFTLDG